MKRLKDILVALVLALTLSLGFSGCSYLGYFTGVQVSIPARPVLVTCPEKPILEGDISPDKQFVVLTMESAAALANYIKGLAECSGSNVVILSGHIEKLENRLKALGSK